MAPPTIQAIRDALVVALEAVTGLGSGSAGLSESSFHFDDLPLAPEGLLPRSFAVAAPSTTDADPRQRIRTRPSTEEGWRVVTTVRARWVHRLRVDSPRADLAEALGEEQTIMQGAAAAAVSGIGPYRVTGIDRRTIDAGSRGLWHLTEVTWTVRHVYAIADPAQVYTPAGGGAPGVCITTLAAGVIESPTGTAAPNLGTGVVVDSGTIVPVLGTDAAHVYNVGTELLGSDQGTQSVAVSWSYVGGKNRATFTGVGAVADSNLEAYVATLPVYDAGGNLVDLSQRRHLVYLDIDIDVGTLASSDAPIIRLGFGEVSGGAAELSSFTGLDQAISVGIIGGATTGDHRTSEAVMGASDSTTGAAGVHRMIATYLPAWETTAPAVLPVGTMSASFVTTSGASWDSQRTVDSTNACTGSGEFGLLLFVGQSNAGTTPHAVDFTLRALAHQFR